MGLIRIIAGIVTVFAVVQAGEGGSNHSVASATESVRSASESVRSAADLCTSHAELCAGVAATGIALARQQATEAFGARSAPAPVAPLKAATVTGTIPKAPKIAVSAPPKSEAARTARKKS